MQSDIREITIDLSIPTEKTIGIFQQYDIDSHILRVSITNNRVPYPIDTGSGDEVRLEYTRPDGKHKWYVCTVENNVVTINFVQEMLEVSGVALMKLVVMNQTSRQAIHTSLFRLMIGDGVITTGDIIDNDDYRNILSMLLKIQDLQQSMQDDESERQQNEAERIANETARKSSEILRDSNERRRESEYEEFKSEYTSQLEKIQEAVEIAEGATEGVQEAINNANAAADRADKVASEIEISEEVITEAVKKVDEAVKAVSGAVEEANAAADRADTAATNTEDEIANIQKTNSDIKDAESKRVDAEKKRAETFDVLSSQLTTSISKADTATQNAEDAADAANTAKENIDTALTEFDGIKTEIDSAVEQATSAVEEVSQAISTTNDLVSRGTTLFEDLEASESIRVQQEQARESAESSRVEAESQREQSVADAINDADAATQRANEAAQAAEDVVAGKGFIASAEKGAANGVAPLNSEKQVDKTYLPPYPTSLPANGGNADTVGGHTVEKDVPADADFTKYVHPSHSPASSGLYKITVDDKGHVSAVTPATKEDITGLGIEPAFTKNSAFNKNFGTSAGTVCQGNDSRLSNARPASDVSAWAKQPTKPSYSWGEILDKPADKTMETLLISLNGKYQYSYDGTSEQSITIDPDSIDAAPVSHVSENIGSSNGSHGLRYYNDKLEYKSGSVWNEIKTGGSAGLTIGGTALSSSATVSDSNAEFPVIQKTTSAAGTLFDISIPDLMLGKYSVTLRIKSSDGSKSNNIVSINTFYSDGASVITPLKTVSIAPSDIGRANSYQVLGFTIDFNGANISNKKLRIQANILQVSPAITVSIDYMQITSAFAAIDSL